MKIFVTGGCGFLGSHVCEHFICQGWEAVSYDSMTKYELSRTGYNAQKARDCNRDFLAGLGVQLIQADVCHPEKLLDAVSGADFIVHTAAQPAMTISNEAPQLDFETNVAGTFNVLEAARRHNLPVASCSTIHVYGNRLNHDLTETDTRYIRTPPTIGEETPTMQGALSPLHASKRCAEIYSRVWADQYHLRSAMFRLTGLYGPRQFAGEDHGWVAHFMIRAITNRPLTLFGSGKQVRDILYATDAARAFENFYLHQQPGVYNIGGGVQNSVSLLECIRLIEKLTDQTVSVRHAPERPGDMRYFVCDTTRAQKQIGFKPEISPETGLQKLAEWITAHKAIFDAS